ncbi:MAG: hypothetical protein H6559_12255 [Lewinellaceae bacterium]|nr:hypothetical protein [Lewinellaceae bacterium]
MSAVEIRAEINAYLEKVQDESFLKVVHSMLNTYVQEQEDPIEGYDIHGNPMRASQLMNKYETGLAAVKRGDFITVEELEERSNNGSPIQSNHYPGRSAVHTRHNRLLS